MNTFFNQSTGKQHATQSSQSCNLLMVVTKALQKPQKLDFK